MLSVLLVADSDSGMQKNTTKDLATVLVSEPEHQILRPAHVPVHVFFETDK